MAVLQGYSGPASPYWASKGFLGLLLPPDHEVWTATEEPGPVERDDEVRPVGPPNWLLQSTSSDGVVRLHNHGSEDVRYDPFYTRLAYSTVTEPVPLAEPSESYDNSVIVDADPSRTDIEPLGVGAGWAASRHTVGDGGVRVTSLVVARGAVEVRVHLVAGAAPGTPVRVTGWAEAEGLECALHPAYGLSGADGPGLTGETADADATLFVALARLTADPDPRPLPELVSVEVRGTYEVSVTWAHGERAQFVFTASDGRSSASSWSVTPR